MRSKWLALALVVALAGGTAHAQNQIPNWEFDQPVTLTTIWSLWQPANFTGLSIVENAGLSGRYAMKVDIGPGPFTPLQVFRGYCKLEQGKKYYISFMAKADAPRKVTVQLQARTLYNYRVYWAQRDVQLTTEPQIFNYEYTHTHADGTVGGTGVFNNDIDFHFLLVGDGTDLYLDRIWLATEPPPPMDNTIVARPFKPVPDDTAVDVPADTSLSWVPGIYAQTHNVYLGTSFDDANTVDLSQAVSKGQTATTFQPAGPLDYGQTYYWRVDEVNAPPSSKVFRGDVWSFTVEPFAYPITGVTTTASSSDKTTTGPTNTVNGSGLANDLHSTVGDAMWLCSTTDPGPVWIRFAFDGVYKLHELWVWNHNGDMEAVLGMGFKDVTIETSTEGTTWTPLKDVQFAQAPGLPGYAHNTTVDLDGVMARYVRLTAKSNWSLLGWKQYGLAEVRFFYLPVEARAPQPAQYAEGVAVDTTLDWRPGREATSHLVTFGTDRAAVADETATSKTLTTHGLRGEAFDFGAIYYWKVNEIGPTTYPGGIWSFTTQEYRTIEDFESYTDQEGSLVYKAWVDGLTDRSSGSIVGLYPDPANGTYCETRIVHGGKQSVPMEYHNDQAPYYSEAVRTFDTPQDWTTNGANTLSLWLYGSPAPASPAETGNSPADVYVTLKDSSGNSATVTYPNGTNVNGWTEWKIPLSDFAGIKLTAIKSMVLGIGSRTSPKAGAIGKMYFDDIRVGKPIVPVGLVASYSLEGDVKDGSGNRHDGTVVGTVTYGDGPPGKGQALLFPGTPNNAVKLGTFNPSEKTGMLSISLWAKWNGLSSYYQGLIGKRDSYAAGDMMWQIEASQTTGGLSFARSGSGGPTAPALTVGEWTHIATTFDKVTARFYVNGIQTGSSAFSFGSDREASMQFGQDNATGNAFNGTLDEVKLYDFALSPAEVLTLAGK